MLKRTIHILLLSSTVLMSAACSEKYLDRSSLAQLAENNFWKNERDAQLGVNGIYEALQDRVLYSGTLNGPAGIPIFDGLTDNCFGSYKFEGPGNFMEGRTDPANSFFNLFWTANYKGIARANAAIANIEKIPDADITAESRAALIGQAKFLRALFYFNIALYFEEAPLILEVQTLETAYVGKNSYQEITSAIIQDLTDAAAALPVSYPADKFGYATKGAALGLLARVQLYNKNYDAVLAATEPMLNMGYGLYGNYGNLFSPAGEITPEIVFSVRFIQDQSNNGELFSATFLGIPKVNVQPMRNLVRDYYCTDGLPITSSPLYSQANQKANRDPRLTASVYFQGDIFITDLGTVFRGNTATTFGQKKYLRSSASATGIPVTVAGGQDFYVIRYADILLMRAEALTELNRGAEAYPLVNEVRARVNMPAVETVEGADLSQEQMREVIRHERRVEFAFEGLRFYDLKRWGQIEQAFQRADADPVPPYNPVYQGRRSEVFPIPQSELDANRNLSQNPVWN
ncbi:MAG: RagB/SusD family nutrient uptake outer membrane protein [Flavihumibacter sp.]|nr:RagB/SusD family nutrient uptake outer membrane protein [Flavihumibacter sp.]